MYEKKTLILTGMDGIVGGVVKLIRNGGISGEICLNITTMACKLYVMDNDSTIVVDGRVNNFNMDNSMSMQHMEAILIADDDTPLLYGCIGLQGGYWRSYSRAMDSRKLEYYNTHKNLDDSDSISNKIKVEKKEPPITKLKEEKKEKITATAHFEEKKKNIKEMQYEEINEINPQMVRFEETKGNSAETMQKKIKEEKLIERFIIGNDADNGAAAEVVNINKNMDNRFYYSIKDTLDEMFICYPEEMKLKELVPDSKWVRIDSDDSYYVVGIIEIDDNVEYICYGLPATSELRPPDELKDYCEWFPLDSDTGYWIVFQDGKTGETIKKI